MKMTRLEIAADSVWVVSSPCPNKTCIGLGKAHQTGDLLACLPNQVNVRIAGGKRQQEQYDILSH